MALTFQDVVSDAKKLSDLLRDRESTADELLTQVQSICLEVETMKEYKEDIEQLNDLASTRPRMALIAGIQQENRYIMDLQQENRELKMALEEQQNAVDLIMSKYRQHVSKLIQCRMYEQQLIQNMYSNSKAVDTAEEKMNEMKFVMQKAASMDEDALSREEELMSRLITENKGLRETLQIANGFGLVEAKVDTK